MKDTKRPKPKLVLARETVRVLSSSELAAVAGGGEGDDCTTTDFGPCRMTTWYCFMHCWGGTEN